MKPESRVKTKVHDLLKQLNAYSLTVTTMGMGASGHPDRVACIAGCFVGIECKAAQKNNPAELQAQRLNQIVDARGFAFIVDADNFDRFETLMWAMFTPGTGAAMRRAAWTVAMVGRDTLYWR